MSRKPNPERVHPTLARMALARAKDAQSAYSEYVLAHYRGTGSLDAGCNATDLVAWYQANMPQEWAGKGGK